MISFIKNKNSSGNCLEIPGNPLIKANLWVILKISKINFKMIEYTSASARTSV